MLSCVCMYVCHDFTSIIIVSLRVDHLNGVEDVAIFSFVVRFVESVSALIVVHIYHT